ncbi:MAG: chorismate mutase [Chloroflexota bacterium]|nr:chorismate mutase [Chloroflexota bacterium]
MNMRGIRGATTIESDTSTNVLAATCELLEAMLAANTGLEPAAIGSAIFTVTDDICSAFPARAARELGWATVPMLDGREIPVPGGLPLCIRVLLHWNTDREQAEIRHIYLRGARALRPDLESSNLEPTEEEKK